MNQDEIRSRLKNGETIEKVCQEYNLSFSELVNLMKTKANEEGYKPTPSTGHLYVSERYGKFFIRKGTVYYGTYYSLEDALKVRDYFMFSRWDKRNIDKVCRELGVRRA